MTGIDKERLFVFVGTEDDVQRYQKLLEHLIQQGNRVIVVTLEDAEPPTLITPHGMHVGRADIDFVAKEFLEGAKVEDDPY
jgi:hypothetical protein